MEMTPVLQLVMRSDGGPGFAWNPLVPDFEKLPLSNLSMAAILLLDMIQQRMRAAMQVKTPLHGPEASQSQQLAEELRKRRMGGPA